MDGWTDGRTDGWTDGQTDGRTEGWMGIRQTGRQTDRQKVGQTDEIYTPCIVLDMVYLRPPPKKRSNLRAMTPLGFRTEYFDCYIGFTFVSVAVFTLWYSNLHNVIAIHYCRFCQGIWNADHSVWEDSPWPANNVYYGEPSATKSTFLRI